MPPKCPRLSFTCGDSADTSDSGSWHPISLVSVVVSAGVSAFPAGGSLGQADQRVKSKVFEEEGFEFAAGVYGLLTDRWSRVYLLPWPPLAWQVRRAAAQAGLGGNMRKAVVLGIALLVTSVVVLGGTVFRQQVADASSILSVFVTNDSSHPVPVREQNLDGGGNIKVHEQGTANVNVTNSSLTVASQAPITGGAVHWNLPCPSGFKFGTVVASALTFHLSAGVEDVELRTGTSSVAYTAVGPALGGPADINLALDRPISFDTIECTGSGTWAGGIVGNSP
jgi:hypothetical protein